MTGGRKGPDSSKKIGSRYEQAAADFLQDRGYKILERNFRCPAGEIDIIARAYPKKFEPVSPINVLAGEKLNGKNPTSAPAKAVIKITDTIDEPLSTNIISNDTADITDIPEDNPSKPSIKLIAFVTITTHAIVKITDVT